MTDPDVIYQNTVDSGAFSVVVTGLGEHTGRFVVTATATDEILLDKPTGLSFGAIFGPDVDDVARWEAEAIEVIDAWIEGSKVDGE